MVAFLLFFIHFPVKKEEEKKVVLKKGKKGKVPKQTKTKENAVKVEGSVVTPNTPGLG